MLFSVSTVKDTVDNVRRFVTRNLAHGIDHMFLFLDEPQPEVAQYVASHPHATSVEAHGSWWADGRPGLNRRQNTNADVAQALLTRVSGDHWLFHIDADEVVVVDRERLEDLPSDVRVVHLAPLEAVSQEVPVDHPTLYKRRLTRAELNLLAVLQLIDAPTNGAYFHGHARGEAGFRPALDLRAGIHDTLTAEGHPVEGFAADWLEHLHFDPIRFPSSDASGATSSTRVRGHTCVPRGCRRTTPLRLSWTAAFPTTSQRRSC